MTDGTGTPPPLWRLAWLLAAAMSVALSWVMQGHTAFAVAAGAVLLGGGLGLSLESAPSTGGWMQRFWRPAGFGVIAAVGLLELGPCLKDPYGVGAGQPSRVPVRLAEVALRGPEWTYLGLDSGYSITCPLWMYGVAIAWLGGLVVLAASSLSGDKGARREA